MDGHEFRIFKIKQKDGIGRSCFKFFSWPFIQPRNTRTINYKISVNAKIINIPEGFGLIKLN